MPYIGLPPFLPLQCTCEEEIHAFVSMPYIGLPPFLPEETQPEETQPEGVNALYRASPISTMQKKRQE